MLPAHFAPERVSEIYRVAYEQRAHDARRWRERFELAPSASDTHRVGLLLVDVQNTFCIPEFELFVAGRSGTAAVDDNTRLCRFLYENLASITTVHATMDTHTAMQIFHSEFFVDARGGHPAPMTAISLEDVEAGRWRVSPRVRDELGVDPDYLLHYCRTLSHNGLYSLMVWPHHAMLGGIGHALVSAIEEAVFFHSIARSSPTRFELKGMNPLTENYSVLSPEVVEDANGSELAKPNHALTETLLGYDALIIAGQAKSHCVAWTVADLLSEIQKRDHDLARKVFLLEDCSSPVVVPGVVDFTEESEAAYREFEAAGMHRVRSSEPLESWADGELFSSGGSARPRKATT